jgi:hypothetical protein
MIRLDSLKTFGLTADPTWDNIPTTFWSTLETSTAIFCACMPAIRAGIIRFSPNILGPPTHSDSISPNQPSKSFDDEPIPSRIVEGKHEGNPVSLLPTTIGTKTHQFSRTATSETTEVEIKDSETKHDIGSIRHIISLTEYLRRTERDKPLPLLPIPDTDQSPKSPKPSAERGEIREVEDSTENNSSTHYHSKGFV